MVQQMMSNDEAKKELSRLYGELRRLARDKHVDPGNMVSEAADAVKGALGVLLDQEKRAVLRSLTGDDE